MNILRLSEDDIQAFINEHKNADVPNLLLKIGKTKDWPMNEVVQQIEGRKKAEKKLPALSGTKGIVYPPRLNLEQSSSETTANYKAQIVSGATLVDLTGGFGIDTIAFAQHSFDVLYVERNKELCEIVRHNLSLLKLPNVHVRHADLNEVLDKEQVPDVYYLDPARRSGSKKVIKLEDCEPDVLTLMPKLQRATMVLIKTSPMLDIEQCLRDLTQVKSIHVVSVNNECKEVLYLLQQGTVAEPEYHAVNFLGDNVQHLQFTTAGEESSLIAFSDPLTYLYEPNPAILKAGAFKLPASVFDLFKLAPNTHLYTSEKIVKDFPGRIFRVKAIVKYAKEDIKKSIPELKANITLRNFPDSVQQIRKRTGLREGGENYIFASTLLNQKPVLILTEKYS